MPNPRRPRSVRRITVGGVAALIVGLALFATRSSTTAPVAAATQSCQAGSVSASNQPVADLIAERTNDVAALAGIDTSQPAGRRAAIDLSLHLKALDEGIADEAITTAEGALHAKALDDAAADDRIAAQGIGHDCATSGSQP